MSISRRSFLKLFAAAPAVAAVGLPEISYAEVLPEQSETLSLIKQNEKTAVGYMRETIAYDLVSDQHIIRHDVTDGKSQWEVHHKIPFTYTDKMLSDARNASVTSLRKKLKELGIRKVSAPPNHWEESKHVRFA